MLNMRAVLVTLILLGLERATENSGIGLVDTRGLDIALSIFLEVIQRFPRAKSGSFQTDE